MIDPANPDFTSTPAARDRRAFAYAPAVSDVEPIVTIVTPFYNTEPSLFEETVKSVLNQSLQQWEWVIVDDASTLAESRDALARLSSADARIRVVTHEQNRGLPASRNTGIAHARAQFVLPIDSDDLVEPTAAEKWLWFLISYPEFCWVNGFHVAFGEQEYLWRHGFHNRELFLRENFANPTGIARRELFSAVGGFDEELREGLEDWEFWLRSAAAGRWGATVPEFLWWYRRRGREAERWSNWDGGQRQQELLRNWRRRYPNLSAKTFPRPEPRRGPGGLELDFLPFQNALAKTGKRLLMIVPWMTTGGADKFNLDVVSELRRRAWEVTVVATQPGDNSWAPHMARITSDVFILEHFLRPGDYPRFFRYLIESRSPDALLISNSVVAYRALPYLRRAAPETPIVDFCHSVHPVRLNGGYPRLSVERTKYLDLHVVSSRHLKRWMAHEGADPDRVAVCYTNIETAPPHSARALANPEPAGLAELGVPEGWPVIIYPCRIDVEKQPAVFAKTMLELHCRGHSFVALVVGDGPYLRWLQGFVRKHRLGAAVRFLGRRSNDEVRSLIAASDVLFLPSQFEGISLAFFEAMAEGVAIVGADVGGQRELVTPECGTLVERGDEASEVARYAQALGDLLDDPVRRKAMGMAGEERVRDEFPLDAMGTTMDELLRRAQDLVRTDPRPAPEREEARLGAVEAIREVAWAFPGASSLGPVSDRMRLRLYVLLVRIGMPVHRLGIRLGFHWIEDVRQRVANTLQRKA